MATVGTVIPMQCLPHSATTTPGDQLGWPSKLGLTNAAAYPEFHRPGGSFEAPPFFSGRHSDGVATTDTIVSSIETGYDRHADASAPNRSARPDDALFRIKRDAVFDAVGLAAMRDMRWAWHLTAATVQPFALFDA